MAPLSILPGRVRFEDKRLSGNQDKSRHVETTLAVIPGVNLVSASHRTGRILVEFCSVQIAHDDLITHIREALAGEFPVSEVAARSVATTAMPGKEPSFLSGSLFADMALHMLLPAPFDLLLPAVESKFRREPCKA